MPPKRKAIDNSTVEPGRKRSRRAKTAIANAGASTSQQEQAHVLVPVEKRLARFKASCPGAISERVERVMTQRFFMVERERREGELREEFKVLGSTGNVYTVVIDKLPSCNCPDATKGNHCKHILFVFLKVLAVPLSSHIYYQKALITSELEEVFANAPVAPNSLANSRIKAAYAKATGKQTETDELEAQTSDLDGKKRIPQEGDDCPICYEDMHGVDTKTLVFCETCGNALHKECFQNWARSKTPVTCVYCRAEWRNTSASDVAGSSRGKISAEGYLNLGSVAGLSPVRDTSSYYSRYGYGSRRYYY